MVRRQQGRRRGCGDLVIAARAGGMGHAFAHCPRKVGSKLEPGTLGRAVGHAALDALTLADGRHLLVYNPSADCRSPLVVALSEDGQQWRDAALIEGGGGEFSYPAIISGEAGLVHIAYSSRRRTIGHVTLDPRRL